MIGAGLWALKILTIAGMVGGIYWWIADTHYDRGYAARQLELHAAVQALNDRLAETERRAAADEEARQKAVAEALAAIPAEWGPAPLPEPPAVPGQPGPVAAPIPERVRLRLNTIH